MILCHAELTDVFQARFLYLEFFIRKHASTAARDAL